jgi:7-keto-8-aminopelargonate synthetase-like enzyme
MARLRANVDRLRPGHGSPIVPFVCGAEGRALAAADALAERGLLVTAIRPPTVPPGTSRLRVALSAAHTADQVDRLASALAELFPDGP